MSLPEDRASLLTIRLFGTLEAYSGASPLTGLRLREGERLLAYFTLQQGLPITYHVLAQQFWPSEARLEYGAQGQYPSTRQAVHSLRQALGTHAERLSSQGKGILCFDLSGAEVDVTAFDRLAQADDPAGWREAVALYRAPLLENWTESWAAEARARRKRSYERMLKRLIPWARERGDLVAQENYLRRILALSPLEENWTRELLDLLLAAGRYIEAEESYEDLCVLLKAQNRSPQPETAERYATLQNAIRQTIAVRPEIAGGGDERSTSQAPPGAVSETAPGGKSEADRVVSAPDVIETTHRRIKVALLYKRHAEPDEALLKILERELKARDFDVFIDRHLAIGVEWAAEIERQVSNSDAVVPLISAASIHSEMLEQELLTADRASQVRGGRPRILPIRVAYTGELPARSATAAILEPLQCAFWHGHEDDARLIEEIVQSLRAPTPPRPEQIRLEPIGGAVALTSPFYIVRPTDSQFTAAVENVDSIVLVKGARQMGKTSLLARGLQRARQAGAKVVLTDLQTLSEAQLASTDALFLALATAICLQLDLDANVKQEWDFDFGAGMNLEMFLRRRVFKAFDGPFVWGIDETDRLFAYPFGNEVFGLFRSWHNRRSLDPAGPWSRLTLAIAYATEAQLFITDVNQSPFNVGTRVALQDFTPAEVAELNRRYGEPLRTPDALERFYRMVNGQPYLVRRGLDEMTRNNLSIEDLEMQGDRDNGPFGDHLRRLLVLISQDPQLSDVLHSMLHGRPCPTAESFYRLRSAGILSGEWGGEIQLRCRLYTAYLSRHLL